MRGTLTKQKRGEGVRNVGVWEERGPGRATAMALALNGYFSFDVFLVKLLILSNLSTWLNNYLLNGICQFMSKEKAKKVSPSNKSVISSHQGPCRGYTGFRFTNTVYDQSELSASSRATLPIPQ